MPAPIQPPLLQVQEAPVGDTNLHGGPCQGGGGGGSASGGSSRADVRLAAASRGDLGSTETPTVQRQSWQQLLEPGDWIQTPVLGCKSRCWAPSSLLLWSPFPLHRTGSFPVDMPPPSQELGFFNTDTLLTLLLLPPGWARLEEGDAQLEGASENTSALLFGPKVLTRQHGVSAAACQLGVIY